MLLLLQIEGFDRGECHHSCQLAMTCAYNYFHSKIKKKKKVTVTTKNVIGLISICDRIHGKTVVT